MFTMCSIFGLEFLTSLDRMLPFLKPVSPFYLIGLVGNDIPFACMSNITGKVCIWVKLGHHIVLVEQLRRECGFTKWSSKLGKVY